MKKQLISVFITSLMACFCLLGSVSAYNVISGDTMWKIAENHNLSLSELIEMNPQIENPNLIEVGEYINTENGLMLGSIALPTDNYDSFLTSPLSASATTTFVNDLPSGVSSTIYTIFDSDGVTPREKIYCTGTDTSPNRLTFCTRGVSFSPVNGVITEDAGTGLSHSKNSRIAVTDNINFSGKALAILNGNQSTGSTTLYIGETTSNSIRFNLEDDGKYFYAYNNGTNPYIRFNTSSVKWQWSEDGVNFYNFSSSTVSQLSASSTMATKLVGSEIGVITSSSLGMYNGADGQGIYQMVSTTKNLNQNSEGIYLEGDDDFTWTGQQTFSATTTLTTTTITTSSITNLNLGGVNANQLIDNSYVNVHNHNIGTFFSSSTKTINTEYQNTSSTAIMLVVALSIDDGDNNGNYGGAIGQIGESTGVLWNVARARADHEGTNDDQNYYMTMTYIVPAGYYYKILNDSSGGSATIRNWHEFKL